jgi:hypothetical protein
MVSQAVPVLGIRIDHNFLEVPPKRRAIMFASGALASMFFPLVPLIYALHFLQMWMAQMVGLFTIVNVVFTIMFS